MSHIPINPWSWQSGFGFSQGVKVTMPKRILEISGQCATGPDGVPQGAGDMAAQIALAMDNVETVLREAGMGLSDLVRIRVFATDIGSALENWGAVVGRLNNAGCHPASTLVGTTGLFHPDLLIEIEATAAA